MHALDKPETSPVRINVKTVNTSKANVRRFLLIHSQTEFSRTTAQCSIVRIECFIELFWFWAGARNRGGNRRERSEASCFDLTGTAKLVEKGSAATQRVQGVHAKRANTLRRKTLKPRS